MSKGNLSKRALALAMVLLFGAFLSCNPLRARMGQSTMFEDTAMSDAAAAFKEKLGGSFKALYVQIKKDSVTLRAQDPKQPTNVNEYQYPASAEENGAQSPAIWTAKNWEVKPGDPDHQRVLV